MGRATGSSPHGGTQTPTSNSTTARCREPPPGMVSRPRCRIAGRCARLNTKAALVRRAGARWLRLRRAETESTPSKPGGVEIARLTDKLVIEHRDEAALARRRLHHLGDVFWHL